MKPRRDWIVLTLAIGMATALNLFVAAALWDALFGHQPGLSENGTQILTGWGGGVIGVLGAYIGAGLRADTKQPPGAPEGEAGAPGGVGGDVDD